MKLAALVLLVAVGIAFNGLGTEALTPDKITKTLMGGAPPYWKVCFALDSSSSIDVTEWRYSKLAARDTLAIINYTPGANSIRPARQRIGLVRFSTWAQVIVTIGKYPFFSANDLAIKDVTKLSGMTHIYQALAKCDGQLGSFSKRLVWMTTDGYHNRWGDPVAKAKSMRSRGITICIVAIGNNVNTTKIYAMASRVKIRTSSGFELYVACVLRYNTYAAYRSATYAARLRVLP